MTPPSGLGSFLGDLSDLSDLGDLGGAGGVDAATGMVAPWWAAVAIGAALLVASAPTLRVAPGRRWWPGIVLAVAVLLWAAVVGTGWRLVAPGLVLTAVVAAGWRLRRRSRRGRRAAEVSARVRECCESLAGELAVGIPPSQALEAAAEIWSPWRQVVAAHRVGGSVPDGMRALAAAHPGAEDLRQVAAAWELSQHAGSALADSLAVVATDIAEKQTVRALVRTELSSARSTARLVVALPVFTLAVGSGNGNPVGWLLGTPAGWVCLAAGSAAALAGLGWIEAIAAAVERESG